MHKSEENFNSNPKCYKEEREELLEEEESEVSDEEMEE